MLVSLLSHLSLRQARHITFGPNFPAKQKLVSAERSIVSVIAVDKELLP